MLLVLGGQSAGKREYVKSLGYTDCDFTNDINSGRPVLYELEKIVRETDADNSALYDALLDKEVIICCEVGSGIVPLDKTEREYRDKVGALCVMLAKKADRVVRITAGLPLIIKGEKPCR